MRAVNLLPRDIDQGGKAPRQLPIIVGCAGAVLAAAVLAVGYMQASGKVGSENRQLGDIQAQIAALPQPATPPSTISSLPAEKAARVSALAAALSQRVAWDRLLREVSLVLPDDVWLTSLNATAPSAAAAAVAATGAPAGTTTPATGFTISGYTYSQTGVARLLARLGVIPDLIAIGLQASNQTDVGGQTIVQFTIVGSVTPPGATS